MIDFLLRRGYRFKGTAKLRGDGDPVYAWSRQWVLDTHGPGYPCHEAVLIRGRDPDPHPGDRRQCRTLASALLFRVAAELAAHRGEHLVGELAEPA